MKAVIVGLGYVGLPLAQAAVRSGISIFGLDRSESVVDGLNSGVSHIGDLSDDEVREMVSLGFHATRDSAVIGDADVVVICVPTPLNSAGEPDLNAVMSASRDIATHLHSGLTIILESTTYPGTTEEVLQPIFEASGLQAGTDFHLAFSPERIDPGNKKFGITNTPKIVGGVNDVSTRKAADFYEHFVESVVLAKGTREAETAKLLENTYRHINIALVNELAQLCFAMGIDIWDVVALAKTKPFGFQSFSPSAGVGGHCIPIDPNYLAFKVRAELDKPFQFIELAEDINRGMPAYVAKRALKLLDRIGAGQTAARRVTLLGVTYKPNISDRRESPADPLARALRAEGADVAFYDPFVDEWSVEGTSVPRYESLAEALSQSDLLVVVQAHTEFLENRDSLEGATRPVLDATGNFLGDNVERL